VNRKQALELGERMHRAWARSPGLLLWREMFEKHCDFDPAFELVEQYIETSDTPPTIAGYLATYRRHIGRHHDPDTQRRCRTCDGTGMRSARQVIGGHEHSVVVACADCPTGIAAARVLVAVDTANAKANGNYRQAHGPVTVDEQTSADGPTMTFDEYIATLISSANAGDTDAARMLDLWADNEHRGLIGAWLVKP